MRLVSAEWLKRHAIRDQKTLPLCSHRLTRPLLSSSFAIADTVMGMQIYSYEGRVLSQPKFQGLRPESLSADCVSLSSDVIAILDQTDMKTVRVFDVLTGRPSGGGAEIKHDQVRAPTKCMNKGQQVAATPWKSKRFAIALSRHVDWRKLCSERVARNYRPKRNFGSRGRAHYSLPIFAHPPTPTVGDHQDRAVAVRHLLSRSPPGFHRFQPRNVHHANRAPPRRAEEVSDPEARHSGRHLLLERQLRLARLHRGLAPHRLLLPPRAVRGQGPLAPHAADRGRRRVRQDAAGKQARMCEQTRARAIEL